MRVECVFALLITLFLHVFCKLSEMPKKMTKNLRKVKKDDEREKLTKRVKGQQNLDEKK